jgi:nucleoside-diphosphate-sugar epimerase
MVIGNGLIAKAFSEFEQDDRYLFFCSGVSNSTCKDSAQFQRERDLLNENIQKHRDKIFIYFSTCSIEDPAMSESLYTQHKLDIEANIESQCDRFYIFRLSQVVGKTPNAFTVLNFLFNAVSSGLEFDLWEQSNRNLIDVEDAAAIVRKILLLEFSPNRIINIANPRSYDVVDIVYAIEDYLDKTGNYHLVDKGGKYFISISSIQPIINDLGVDFGADYLRRLLEKYYSK